MSEIILYDYWRSSAAYRVRIALALKGVEFTRTSVNLADAEQTSPEYQTRNPQGLVPCIEVDGQILSQSVAIIDYLDARFPEPKMLPDEPIARAQVMAQALHIVADIHPLNNLRVLKYLKGEMEKSDAAINRWYHHWIIQGLSALEAQAPESGYFGGVAPNLVDVCLVPQIYNARRYDTPLDNLPKLVQIDLALNALAAFQAAKPEAVKPT